MNFLEEVNSIVVTPDELDSILEEGEELAKEGRDDAGAIQLALKVAPRNNKKQKA